MNVTNFPRPYQSVFSEACFTLGGVQDSGGLDIAICSPGIAGPLGVKRFYGTGAASVSVNAAPYVRRLFSPGPMCGLMPGLHKADGRVVSCYIEAPGYSSAAVPLTFGVEDCPQDVILSAAPETVKIRPGERDEISVITSGGVIKPVVVFSHSGIEYTDDSCPPANSEGMMTVVVDAIAVREAFELSTGAPASEMTGFSVELPVGSGTSGGTVLLRRYLIDRTSMGGRRLAWINRYGAIDYHTFPTVTETGLSGGRTRIFTPAGYRTVATAAETSETLVSEPCDGTMAAWLAEIFSSPAVWQIDGTGFERVEISNGGAVFSPLYPRTVSVTVSPGTKVVSRKF
jgi:hypothetical protein